MINPLQYIELSEGKECELLFTPHLYSVAKTRGLDITITDTTNVFQVHDAYLKFIWLAHLNAVEVRRYDGSEITEYSFIEFECWAQNKPQEFGEFLSLSFEFITGKKITDLSEIKQEKKKKVCRSSGIMGRLRSFLSGL